MEQLEWSRTLDQAHTLVRDHPDIFRGAGRWLDESFIKGNRTPAVLFAALCGACRHIETQWDTMSGRRLGYSQALRVLLAASLLSDEHAEVYAAGVSELAALPWESDNPAACRFSVDQDALASGRGLWGEILPIAVQRVEAAIRRRPTDMLVFALSAIASTCESTWPLKTINEHRQRLSALDGAMLVVDIKALSMPRPDTPDCMISNAVAYLTELLDFCWLARFATQVHGDRALDPSAKKKAGARTISLRTLLNLVGNLVDRHFVSLRFPNAVLDPAAFEGWAGRLREQIGEIEELCKVPVEGNLIADEANETSDKQAIPKKKKRRKRDPVLTAENNRVYEAFRRNGSSFAETARQLTRSPSTIRGHVEKVEKLTGRSRSVQTRSGLPTGSRGEVLF